MRFQRVVTEGRRICPERGGLTERQISLFSSIMFPKKLSYVYILYSGSLPRLTCALCSHFLLSKLDNNNQLMLGKLEMANTVYMTRCMSPRKTFGPCRKNMGLRITVLKKR